MENNLHMRVLSKIKHTQWNCPPELSQGLDHAFNLVASTQVWLWYSAGRSPADKPLKAMAVPSTTFLQVLHAGMSKVESDWTSCHRPSSARVHVQKGF